FTHWIGGMGVLVFLLTILSMTGGSSMNLMKAESPGPSVGKLVPKMRQTARFLYGIYFALTLAEFVFLLVAGMPIFDAMNTSFATAGTGGFGIKNDSIASYNDAIKWIVTIFMILFGVNFNAYFFIVTGKIKEFFHVEEVRYYLFIIALSTAIIFWSLLGTYESAGAALLDSAFQVGTIITTTGFSTTNFDLWNSTAKTVLVLLMFCGACAGSTGGGIKVSRFLIALKTVKKEMNSYIHPKSIKKIKIDDKPVEHEVLRSCNVYLITFFMVFIFSLLVVSLDNFDMTTSFTAVAATINNIGPGLSEVGPAGNFGQFSALSKYVFMFDMLAGRLELFPMLILFNINLWNDVKKSHR
ncbi:MAG: TrkH family potassium uptake protein, partial [Lachnospiraceae bacterium]|nr:TrkH family potassium uptake protein [Lachnospiraceae bacterium]